MNHSICKGCHKPLPDGYRHKKCESCRNKTIQNIKTCGSAFLSIAVFAGSTVIALATKGGVNLNSKK